MEPQKTSSSTMVLVAAGCGLLLILLAVPLGLTVLGGAGAAFWLYRAPDAPSPVVEEAEPVQQDAEAGGGAGPGGGAGAGGAPGAAVQGEWGFSESCGQTAGGTGIVVGHTLTITGDKARATANGYQTWLEVDGTLYPVGTDTWDLHVDKSDGTAPKPAGTVVMRITAGKKRLQVESTEWPFACSEGVVKFQREK